MIHLLEISLPSTFSRSSKCTENPGRGRAGILCTVAQSRCLVVSHPCNKRPCLHHPLHSPYLLTFICQVSHRCLSTPFVCSRSPVHECCPVGDGWKYLIGLLDEWDATSMGYTFPDLRCGSQSYTAEAYLGGGRGVSVYDVGSGQVSAWA